MGVHLLEEENYEEASQKVELIARSQNESNAMITKDTFFTDSELTVYPITEQQFSDEE